MRVLVLAVFLGLAGPVFAGTEKPPAAAAEFQAFLSSTSPLCQTERASACVDAAWLYADANWDDRVSLAELRSVQQSFESWLAWSEQRIPAAQGRLIALGLTIVRSIGLDALVASYDADADGLISRDELLADVRLDRRPLGEVLLDPGAVDWKSLSGRLGILAPLLNGLGG